MVKNEATNDHPLLNNRRASFSDESLSTTVGSIPIIDMTTYSAKNVSSDHDFTKEFFPSASPTILSSVPPTSSPFVSAKTFVASVASDTPSSSPSIPPSLLNSSSPSRESISSGFVESCPGITNEVINNELSKYEAFFDYEIVTEIENVNMDDILEVLEERVLEDVASNMLNCGSNRRRTNIMKWNRELVNPSSIVRIDSAPVDTLDKFNVECNRDTGVSDEGDAKCTPVNGAMSFFINCPAGNDCVFPEEEILRTIENGCKEDLYADGNLIKQVNFVGTHDSSPILAVQLSNNEGKESRLDIGLSLGIVALFAVVFAIVYKRRSKPRFEKAPLSEANDSFSHTYDFSESFSEQSSTSESDLDGNRNLVCFHQMHAEIDDEGQVTIMPRMDSSLNWAP